MVPIRQEVILPSSRIGSSSSVAWLYLVAEFLIAAAISGSLGILVLVKSFLPKPPRDLTGHVVLVTGATSRLAESMADEFVRNGCTIVCVDSDTENLQKTTDNLTSRYPNVVKIGPKYRKHVDETGKTGNRIYSYECDLWDRKAIRELANRIKNDFCKIDILVTCAGHSGQDIFDTVNNTLMSHYWTVLAFLPLMLKQERAHVIGVTPTTSTEDAYAGSRAAIAGLMESLGQEFGSRNSNLNFITVAPKADPRLMKQTEQQVARDVVQAVRRDQCTLNANWCSTMIFRISCAIHSGIMNITRWLHTQSCDYPY